MSLGQVVGEALALNLFGRFQVRHLVAIFLFFVLVQLFFNLVDFFGD